MIMCTFVYYSIILTGEAKEGSATLGCGKMIIPNDEALYLKERLNLGKSSYTDLRLLLKDKIVLPTFRIISIHAQSLLPLSGFLPLLEYGLKFNAREAVIRTIERRIEITASIAEFTNIECFEALIIFGYDGSGSHRTYNSSTSLQCDTSHFVLSGFSLSSISVNGQVIFREESPGSCDAERPLYLCPGRENKELVDKFVSQLDSEMKLIQETPLPIKVMGIEVLRKVKCIMSQLDGKCVQMTSGLGGGYCMACDASWKESVSLEKIMNGFPINRSISQCQSIFEDLVETNSEGREVIRPEAGDYAIRKGVTQKPITSFDVCSTLQVTHSWINTLNFFEAISYKLIASVHTFGVGARYSPEEKAKLAKAKNDFRQAAAHGPMALKLDMPDSAGNSGNTDTGNMSRSFFSEKNQGHFVDLLIGCSDVE